VRRATFVYAIFLLLYCSASGGEKPAEIGLLFCGGCFAALDNILIMLIFQIIIMLRVFFWIVMYSSFFVRTFIMRVDFLCFVFFCALYLLGG
jgi:hypothetical protein